jgi:hypothetical protein
MKMTPARKAARGQDCMVRIPGICNGNPETTVLAHYRLSGYCGTGMKPDDFVFGAFACSSCHDACDFRTQTDFTHAEIRLMHAEGILRTQSLVLDEQAEDDPREPKTQRIT